ncbi:phage major capsid protein [Micromonospora orduensis]|uniref:Phage major capsid protein n=1 Tax=Micromonospora orduensis TaxID=1420891 RepID=A0A5C4QDV4_9ACTN|nr:phage major capsid protein [Micromonospora orduensis]TNH21443.1 phage major capsid protein [Micromonospora orduensis]
MAFNDVIGRDENGAIELSESVSKEILKAAASQSVVSQLATRVPMSSLVTRQAQVSGLPEAYFVGSDTGLKQTTKVQWKGVELQAEPIACLVVIPDDFQADSFENISAQAKTLIAEAIGRTIDNACLFGVNKPATWGPSLYAQAVAAGNHVDYDDTKDFGVNAANVALKVVEDGFKPTAYATEPGLRWRMLGERDAQGGPIFTQLAGEAYEGLALHGIPAVESDNGAWDADVRLIAGEWKNALLGVRQDVTVSMHKDGVIVDETGKVLFSAMQSDSQIMRVVTRVAWNVANPATNRNTVEAARSPFALLLNEGTAAS